MYTCHGEPFHQLLLPPVQDKLYLALWIMETFNRIPLLIKANGAVPSVLFLIMPMAVKMDNKSSGGSAAKGKMKCEVEEKMGIRCSR